MSGVTDFSDFDQLAVNTIRFLSVDAVQKANSGHPGLPLDAAPMGYVLWTRYVKQNPRNPAWFDRDRLAFSAGHGSMLLYSLLALSGYFPLERIKEFRQLGSITPGHPEHRLTPGVETTTGPLGQGFGAGLGMAMAEANLAARYNRPGYEIINHFTYGIVSDGDLMEGVSSEAASLAGHLRLGKLIYLYDSNHVTLSESTHLSFSEDVARRFESYGWQVQSVADGNDLFAIDRAIQKAREDKAHPSLIVVRTHIGYGSPHKQDTFEAHGSPLGAEEVKLTKENLHWPVEPSFFVPQEVSEYFSKAGERGQKAEAAWEKLFAEYQKNFPEPGAELSRLIKGELPQNWDSELPTFPADAKGLATRIASGKVLNAAAKKVAGLIGGSGDLNPSTYSQMDGLGDFENSEAAGGDMQGSVGGGWGYAGRNLHFGVREHAMGAALNGMAVHGGLIPYGATFLTFSDYMRPSIRIASLMEAHVIYIFTHDSIGLGEDGPTHQPVEHLAALRAIPHLLVIRPGDANETRVAWQVALEARDRPVALILSRQNVPTLDRNTFAAAEGLRQGAYVLSDPPSGRFDLILVASGSEVGLMVEAGKQLEQQKVAVRLVSMPSWELFEESPREYQESVFPSSVRKRLAIEAGSPQGWCRYVTDEGAVLGINRFGASAPGSVVMREYGFSAENVSSQALALLHEAQA